MHATLPLLRVTDFPPIRRRAIESLQVNLGYTCNQTCVHCHVNAGPNRTEQMDRATIDLVLEVMRARSIRSLDLTGGAPELNVHFRSLVSAARAMGAEVIDRCNLTILEEPGQKTLAEFLAPKACTWWRRCRATHRKTSTSNAAPAYSTRAFADCKTLNALGYGEADSELVLDLVYNPQGPSLPPPQKQAGGRLQAAARRKLRHSFQPTVDDHQPTDFALRQHADQQGDVSRLHGAAAQCASRRQPGRRDVPQPGVGRLARLSV